MKDPNWYQLNDTSNIKSPSLLVYPDRIQYNAELMCKLSGNISRLRPHIKTHKTSEIVDLQLKLGIDKFKCATNREAELLAKCGAPDVLLAMQPVATEIDSYFRLQEKYPKTLFSTLFDNRETLEQLARIAKKERKKIALWIDINNGMNRTGIIPGKEAESLYKRASQENSIDLKGIHVYDGHIHDNNLADRTTRCNSDFEAVETFKLKLESSGFAVPFVVAGGTPTFPIHQKRESVELSPGTPLLWDDGYAQNYQDLKFKYAAVLITRVISKPENDLICLDLGHKSVASEMPLPRVRFLGNHDLSQVSQSEEHLVLKCTNPDQYPIGSELYAVPKHICPTVTKYHSLITVNNNKITGQWIIGARDH
ncbi:D-TA family PLP-dependent enzyme [Lutimonas saemankumensis]|uniref:D-TA family PLP-dependent enzyme n=1 Tax=Lutimonas saemankumensis TaxID=483016 RepID=UPI001CD57525|nr:D-TA family PLP-dependent enzyme [Lutimonas saemankumensis]MCA0931165.1 D-TA family PLP-dependent enzyme [Lutimonas saemankumensis]